MSPVDMIDDSEFAELADRYAFTLLDADVQKYSENQPRVPAGSPEGGQFGSGGSGSSDASHGADESDDTYLSTPSDAIAAIANGEQATVAAEDLRGVLERAAKRDDHPDLTNLTVEGTAIFAGGLNLPRSEMPQIPKEFEKEFLAAMKEQGIAIKRQNVSPMSLHPTQNQIDASKVGQMVAKYDKGEKDLRPILVAKDHYVLDGHHRFAAMASVEVENPGAKIRMPVIRLMVGHQRALDVMLKFTEEHDIPSLSHGKGLRPWYQDVYVEMKGHDAKHD